MTRLMRSFRFPAFGADLQRTESAVPEPAGSEVLLRVAGCGVCHSDLHLRDGYFDLGRGRKLTFNNIQCPFTPGHEISGRVAAAGPDAGDVPRDRNFLVYAWIGCGECESCRDGRDNLCARPRSLGLQRDGGFADYVIVPHPRYVVDIEGLDPIAAAPLGCSGLTTYSALRRFGADLETSPLVVYGAGGLGLMALGLLRMLNAKPAVVVEIDEAKRYAALQAGAAAAIDPRAADASKQIRKAVGQPVRHALDLVGSADTVRQGSELLAAGGRLVVVGLLGGEFCLPIPLLPLKAITLQGSYVGSLAELRELVDLVKRHGLPRMPLDRRPLEEAPAALADLQHGRVVGRAVLVTEPQN
ncbi:MAG TPA: alcohol dehydrogenase [Ramlibacter sp.]|nr:alcohol dehydrogenase [Ramlibacter sp.]